MAVDERHLLVQRARAGQRIALRRGIAGLVRDKECHECQWGDEAGEHALNVNGIQVPGSIRSRFLARSSAELRNPGALEPCRIRRGGRDWRNGAGGVLGLAGFIAVDDGRGRRRSGRARTPSRRRRRSRRRSRSLTRGCMKLKETVSADVLSMYDLGQQMVDMVFSFGELGFQEFETQRYLTGILKQNGFTIETGIAGIPTAWVAKYGIGQAGDRARLGRRLHPAGVAEAGRRVSRSDRRRRAGTRRGPQLRHAAQHPGGDCGQARDGAREAARHHHDLAGRRRRAAGHEGVLRARRTVQGRRRGALQPRRLEPEHVVGRRRRQRPHLRRIHVRRRNGAQRRRAVARPLGARRRRADERGLELSPRASAPAAALALRDHQRRRSAQRRPAQRQRLVLLPRNHVTRASRTCGTSATRWPKAPR